MNKVEDELNDDSVDNGEGDEQSRGKDVRRNGRGKRKQPKRHVSHGYHLVEGKMKHGMEDYLVASRKKTSGHELGLYGIFDGHSGNKVAEYLADHLFDNILNEVLVKFDVNFCGFILITIFWCD